MKRVIIEPQTDDMGEGTGEIKLESNTKLKEVLDFYCQNSQTWGTCIIKFSDGEILRKFDFDLWNHKLFYYKLTWELGLKVKKVTFYYSYMYENLTIMLDE